MTWCWLNDLFTSLNIPLVLAHAKYVKAIAYAKVKTDKVDSQILAQLLRMNFIPEAHKITNEIRLLRDTLRARLRLSQKRTSALNFMQRMLDKFNIDDPSELDDINRFPSENNFFSYCRLVPAASNSGGKTRQKSTPKDGNKYLKIVFSDAAVHAKQYYPVIRKFSDSKLRKKNKIIAKTIVAKEIARIVYHTLKNKTDFNHRFKGIELQHRKSKQWPRVTSPNV